MTVRGLTHVLLSVGILLGAGPGAAQETTEASSATAPSSDNDATISRPASAAARQTTEETVSGPDAVDPLIEWHIQRNLCPGHWSVAEFKLIFPAMSEDLVEQVC